MCDRDRRERTVLWESSKDVGQHSHNVGHQQLLCPSKSESFFFYHLWLGSKNICYRKVFSNIKILRNAPWSWKNVLHVKAQLRFWFPSRSSDFDVFHSHSPFTLTIEEITPTTPGELGTCDPSPQVKHDCRQQTDLAKIKTLCDWRFVQVVAFEAKYANPGLFWSQRHHVARENTQIQFWM